MRAALLARACCCWTALLHRSGLSQTLARPSVNLGDRSIVSSLCVLYYEAVMLHAGA